MVTRTSLWAAAACAAIAMVAGCSGVETPEPSIITTVSPTGQPAISRPLDATRYANKDRICELLTQEQAERLDVRDDDGPTARTGRDFYTCEHVHKSPSTPFAVNVNIDLLPSSNWLDDLYKPEKDDNSTWITISGQPAVAYGPNVDPPSSCRVAIGLTEQQSAFVWVTDSSRDACEVAEKVGLEIVRNLS